MNTKNRGNVYLVGALALVFVLGGAFAAMAADRVAGDRSAVPPPGGGEGVRIAPLDLEGPYVPGTQPRSERLPDDRELEAMLKTLQAEKDSPDGDIGGDDVLISTDPLHRQCSMDISSAGDIYLATETGGFAGVTPRREIRVYLSKDGGTTWESWGLFQPVVGTNEEYTDPCLHIAEGVADRCYLAFHFNDGLGGFHVQVAWSELSSASGSWTTQTVFEDTGISYSFPSITSDAGSYDSYYLYLAVQGYDGGSDIWFTRSIDRAATFETPYMIAEMSLDDRGYNRPSVSYGYGGYVHVGFHFAHHTDVYDEAVRYRGASGWAGGGLGSWGTIQYLTSNSDSIKDRNAVVCASTTTQDVMFTYGRTSLASYILDPGQYCSYDQGATWPDNIVIAGDMGFPSDLSVDPVSGDWVLGGSGPYPWGPVVMRAPGADPMNWSVCKSFVDDNSLVGTIWSSRAIVDPTRNGQVAAAWVDLQDSEGGSRYLMFDAEWRSDPGYPIVETGFPLALDHQPISPPAVVDLDGDGDLEIVYGDNMGRIQVRHHTGVSVAGWPVDTGHSLSDGPVAIGELTPGDEKYVVAGTSDGYVFAYHPDGTLASGWPVYQGAAAPAYVSIGSFGGPMKHVVVVGCFTYLRYLDYKGTVPAGLYLRAFSSAYEFSTPPAIGDIDGDGNNDVMVSPSNLIYAYDPRGGTYIFYNILPSNVSDAVTLGDLDLDGEVEIFVPTNDGTLYAFQEDGTDYNASFPFVSSTGTPLTSAAVAQCLGTWEPELAVAARNFTVHLLYGHSGEETPWSPVSTTYGWYLFGAPIMGRVDGTSSDILIGDRGSKGWGWDNIGQTIQGWPRGLGGQCQLSPAMGDLDLDGSTEIVFLTLNQLIVYDINQVANEPFRTWPMYGHDPRRTGCSDCFEDLATPVEDVGAAITHVSFAQPSPNPMSGPGIFRFAVPIRSAVSLEVFDIRGRRVRTVLREEVDIGERIVSWDGRDGRGRDVAAGQYLARLRVRGPGVNEEMIRKVVVLR